MTGPGRQQPSGIPPIGRRMAQLRARRGISQQVLANRLGKSESWVGKVERGERRLDRLSVIESVAEALGVSPEVLLTHKTRQRTPPIEDVAGAVERVRVALACYDSPGPGANNRQPPSSVAAQLEYAWTAYQHADHTQVLRMLPDLLTNIRATTGPQHTRELQVQVYRITAQELVKLGEPHLAWLAADRAMATAAGNPRHTAIATVSLAQALRALNRGRLAMAAAITAVRQLTPPPSHQPAPDDLALTGTLLIEAALSAATYRDTTTARHLADRAARLADTHDSHPDLDSGGIWFGSIVVDLARALIAADLGDNQQAITTHQYATSSNTWPRLPAEHRAAHLIDITHAHLDLGNPRAAGRALVTADRIAPAETRIRPAARTALTAVLRTGSTSADVTRLATTIGLARR
ncbi:helix-turn-helix domain-containing protein [Micromonospora sp. NPDC003197]